MRAVSVSVVLSSIVLGGWLIGADAQNAGLAEPSAPGPAIGAQIGDGDSQDLPGVIPEPSIDAPGMVVGVTFGELYTDNLTLAGAGTPKQTSWITQIQPFLKWAHSGPRFSGVVDYTLTGYLYQGRSRDNQLAQRLNAKGTLTILPQHFFLDGTALYGREVINNQLPAGSGTFFLDNNRANVAMGMLSPYWLQDLGNLGSMTLRYTYGRIMYNRRGISAQHDALLTGVPDVTSNGIQFRLVSPADQIWGWNLGYSEQRLQPDFGPTLQFAMATVGGSFQVNDSTRLLADVGKETKFLPGGTTQKLGARFWDVGGEWSNTRDYFKVLAGHRFFGRSFQFSWTHQAALLTTNLNYVEQPTDYNQQLFGLNPGTAAISDTIPSLIPSLIERQPYLSKRLSGSAAYTMPQSTLKVTIYDESRKYFAPGSGRERVADADVAWLFNVGALTTFTPSYGWRRYQFRDGQLTRTHYAQLALVHQLDPKNFGSLRLRNDSSDVYTASPGAHGYRVNVLFLQWTHLF